jgi:hypothetical protein
VLFQIISVLCGIIVVILALRFVRLLERVLDILIFDLGLANSKSKSECSLNMFSTNIFVDLFFQIGFNYFVNFI